MDPVESPAAPHALGGKIRSAYFWVAAGSLAKYVAGFGISIILARLLQPADYGIVGIVTALLAILSTFQELGFGQALVHFDEEPRMLPTYFTMTALVALVLTAVLLVSAPGIAIFYREPRLTPVLRLLSLNLLLAGLQAVPNALMTKSFRFQALSYRDLFSTVVAGLVGVVLAYKGFGVWSLVANMLVWGTLQTGLLLYIVRPSFGWRRDLPAFGRMLRYGLPLTGAALMQQFYDNSDYLIVGRMLGATGLGYYTVAFRLASLAHEKLGVIINRVAFPSFAAMQHKPQQVVEHWLAVSRNTILMTGPILAFTFVANEDLVSVIFGVKWLPASVPLRYLCIMGLLRTLVNVTLHLLNSIGKTKLGFRFSAVASVVMPTAFAIGCWQGGLKGVGIAWAVVYPLFLVYLLFMVKGVLPLTFRQYLLNLRLPLVAIVVLAVAMQAAALPVHNPVWRLVVRGVVGGVVYTLFLLNDPPIRARIFSALALLRPRPAVS